MGVMNCRPPNVACADLDKDAREQFMRLWCEAERQAKASDG